MSTPHDCGCGLFKLPVTLPSTLPFTSPFTSLFTLPPVAAHLGRLCFYQPIIDQSSNNFPIQNIRDSNIVLKRQIFRAQVEVELQARELFSAEQVLQRVANGLA